MPYPKNLINDGECFEETLAELNNLVVEYFEAVAA